MARSRPGWRRKLEGDRGGIRSAMIPPRQNHGGSEIVWGKQVLLQNSRGFERAWTWTNAPGAPVDKARDVDGVGGRPRPSNPRTRRWGLHFKKAAIGR
jgi:hypothetical protein